MISHVSHPSINPSFRNIQSHYILSTKLGTEIPYSLCHIPFSIPSHPRTALSPCHVVFISPTYRLCTQSHSHRQAQPRPHPGTANSSPPFLPALSTLCHLESLSRRWLCRQSSALNLREGWSGRAMPPSTCPCTCFPFSVRVFFIHLPIQ